MVCPNCGKDIGNSRFCPECGADTSKTAVVKSKSNKKTIFKRWWFWTIIAVFVLVCIGSLSNNHSNPNKTHTKEEAETNDGIVYISVNLPKIILAFYRSLLSPLKIMKQVYWMYIPPVKI